jgi:hypothetical protein
MTRMAIGTARQALYPIATVITKYRILIAIRLFKQLQKRWQIILIDIDESDISIVPKNLESTNPPEES